VSVKGKAWRRPCQVGIKKMSTSEPLMRCRNIRDGVKTADTWRSAGQVQREPVYCLGGGRHRDGMNLIQAFVRNPHQADRFDVKGEIQVEPPRELEYRCEAQGRIIPY